MFFTRDKVELVVLATTTPDDLFGDAAALAATLVAEGAHVTPHCAAFDVRAACNGFLAACVVAEVRLSHCVRSRCPNVLRIEK